MDELFKLYVQYYTARVEKQGTPVVKRLPDSGKTHCNWVSLRLQLYLPGLAGTGVKISPAPGSAGKCSPVNVYYYYRKKGARMSLSGYEIIIKLRISDRMHSRRRLG